MNDLQYQNKDPHKNDAYRRVASPEPDNIPTAQTTDSGKANGNPSIQQLKAFQEMADSSPRVQQFKAFQEMADNSPRVQQFKAYQEMADNLQIPLQAKNQALMGQHMEKAKTGAKTPIQLQQKKVKPNGIKLNAENQKFFTQAEKFVDSEITLYENKISNLEKKYKANNWAIDMTKGEFKVCADRIIELKEIKKNILEIEHSVKAKGGDALLTLMNVVHNEAGKYSLDAKKAIAYAYLNRINYNGGGSIREPESEAEISHYSKLNDRWSGFTTGAEKMAFLRTIKTSFDAAQARFTSNGKNDPTKGATHWVSPKGLPKKKPNANYYLRTYNGMKRYFPNWARSNAWVKTHPDDAKKYFDTAKYKEMEASGVEGDYFLFYKGVKY